MGKIGYLTTEYVQAFKQADAFTTFTKTMQSERKANEVSKEYLTGLHNC
jgi:hypothetical protein